MPTLYEITGELLALEMRVTEEMEETGELSTDTEKAISEWIGDIREASQQKLKGYAQIILNLSAQKKMVDEEKKRLSKRSEALGNSVHKLKDMVQYFMNVAELKKVQAGAFTFTECKNGGLAPLVIEALPAGLPEKYQVHTIEANNSLIREDLKNGVEIENVRLGERGTNVRVR